MWLLVMYDVVVLAAGVAVGTICRSFLFAKFKLYVHLRRNSTEILENGFLHGVAHAAVAWPFLK